MEIEVDEHGFPTLNQFSEDGFVDCVLRITNRQDSQDTYNFDLRASYNGLVLGFGVEIIKGIKGGFDEDMNLIQDHVYIKGIKFYRTGPESDNLITVLASLYGFSDVSAKMTSEERFTGIALHQGEIDMISTPIKMKLFGRDRDDDLEESYNESFFNLDLRNGYVFWNEKDQEYRKPLIRGLSAGMA
ncbi:hypothetical protein OOT00_15830 [Desulfobotulus sp. H1]|uniref:Uncharacterized protein n=1 Tax=Desulfobotulus pelophilus TaxID=2823377 RepID=A0ABT3NE32_9BACT|nr:hypothetical protein [Desulfobotulus pelophilus]MCW7755446.1 hypothetical protein [Desulfobotulus pelophilus]